MNPQVPHTSTVSKRMDKIQRQLMADLTRGVQHILSVTERIINHVPDDCYIRIDVQNECILVDGERDHDQNMAMFKTLVHILGGTPTVHHIADGWDGCVFCQRTHVCVWVTNLSNPNPLLRPTL